jgi:hypothetical protein
MHKLHTLLLLVSAQGTFAIGYYDLFSVILSCGQRLSLFSSFSPPSLRRRLLLLWNLYHPFHFYLKKTKK